jgi:hypothetical protein
VTFRLEPEVLGEARLGYEEVLNPEMFSPHFGVDESGKGDFFGPLVIAGCYVDRGIARRFKEAGIQDSKRIGSDQRIRDFADLIRKTQGAVQSVVVVGPERYNQMYAEIGNLNRLLAWGHARVIENLLEARPDCPRALSDQFGNPALIKRALMKKGAPSNWSNGRRPRAIWRWRRHPSSPGKPLSIGCTSMGENCKKTLPRGSLGGGQGNRAGTGRRAWARKPSGNSPKCTSRRRPRWRPDMRRRAKIRPNNVFSDRISVPSG